MTLAEIEAISGGGESDQVEFKRSIGQRSSGAKAACAMLNGRGGVVLFGITDRSRIEGQEIGVGTVESLVAELRRIEPQALLNPHLVPVGNGRAVILTGLGLIRNGRLLNAAVPLFARTDRLLPDYPQCLLRMARFRGNDKTEFIDNRQEIGNIFDLLQRALRFLRDHLPVAGRVVPDLFERQDDPLYPPDALREALANALCHRDYNIHGGSVGVAIFDDRLEISSPGGLHFGLTPEDLTRPHASNPWNPVIASVLYRRGIIEQWGRGTIQMIELTGRAGLAPPEFEVHGGELLVRFRPTRYIPPSRINLDVSSLQRELLEVLARTGPASLSEIRAELKNEIPRPTVKANLQFLRDLDVIELRGERRWAKWMLKETDR